MDEKKEAPRFPVWFTAEEWNTALWIIGEAPVAARISMPIMTGIRDQGGKAYREWQQRQQQQGNGASVPVIQESVDQVHVSD